MKKRKALALFSGGLDSMIACRMMAEQGIEVIALHFDVGLTKINEERIEFLHSVAEQAHSKLEIVDIHDQFTKDVLFNPKYGYGKGFNPCVDCHGNMFKQAGDLLEKYDADFLISGEVLGERPMSQNAGALDKVLKLSGYEELIVRPMSAKLLEPSKPELKGWVDREKLLDIQGRQRTRQFELVEKYGFVNFESPGGGCLLTEKFFATKMEDLLKHDDYAKEDAVLLKYGRHFRLPDGAKLVLGRDHDENTIFRSSDFEKYFKIETADGLKGPLSILSKYATKEDSLLATKIILTYSKADKDKEYAIAIGNEKFSNQSFDSKNDVIKFLLG
ncbi:MAG: 7-cyano-7-deazaguanine synthase [Campylobacterales bacterium]|nr:7-cyano-7-deazaguanine synthase [Campylobacterales bacterium]